MLTPSSVRRRPFTSELSQRSASPMLTSSRSFTSSSPMLTTSRSFTSSTSALGRPWYGKEMIPHDVVDPVVYRADYDCLSPQGSAFGPPSSSPRRTPPSNTSSLIGLNSTEPDPRRDHSGRCVSPQRPVTPIDFKFRHHGPITFDVYKASEKRQPGVSLKWGGNTDARLGPHLRKPLPSYAQKSAADPPWVSRLNTPFTRFREGPVSARGQQPCQPISMYDKIIFR